MFHIKYFMRLRSFEILKGHAIVWTHFNVKWNEIVDAVEQQALQTKRVTLFYGVNINKTAHFVIYYHFVVLPFLLRSSFGIVTIIINIQ